MDRLFYMCQKIVETTTQVKDQETIDLIASSILSLVINRGYDVLEKIPDILRNTIVISDNRSVLDVQHQVIHNFKEDDELRNANACVTRKFKFENNQYKEDRYLIIPKKSIRIDPIGTIEKTTHELIHLLRYKDATREGDNLVFVEGIATKTIDLKSGITYRRFYTIEETIVQEAAKRATEDLLAYSSELKPQSSMFTRIERQKPTYRSIIYEPHVKFFEQFLEDGEFKRLVNESFRTYSPKGLSRYYNEVMDDNGAFSKLSNIYNKMDKAIDEDNVRDAKKYAELLKEQLTSFRRHHKRLHY